MQVKTTAAYCALLTLGYIVLSVRVIGKRRSVGAALGDGGNAALLRRQRAHANFAEYVPLALVLMLVAELQGPPNWLLHAFGIPLLIGRIVHAYGISRNVEPPRARVLGMALTFAALIGGALSDVLALYLS